MALEVRLSDQDWDKFGGPEWLVVDQDAIDDLPFDKIDPLERDMDMSITAWRLELTRLSARGRKALAWLARQMSGDAELKAPSYGAFNIQPMKIRYRAVGGDQDPPASGSVDSPSPDFSNGSPETAASETPGESSSPGSPDPTTA